LGEGGSVAGSIERGDIRFSKDHVGRRLARLGEQRMREVCEAVGFALGCSG
jgi:hypothetical protein